MSARVMRHTFRPRRNGCRVRGKPRIFGTPHLPPAQHMASTTPEAPESGLIEFEVIEPAVLAAERSKAPADDTLDADLLSVNFGRRKDHVVSPAERMLGGSTIDWLVAFPLASRPKTLCERFPHVANRLAKEWPHRARAAQSLQRLATDRRWGSVGYPVLVQAELERLLKLLPR
jgi:hypothetical protein